MIIFNLFHTIKKYFPWPVSPIEKSVMILYAWANIESEYVSVEHLYFSSQPYLFPHIVLASSHIILSSCNKAIIYLLCETVVPVSFFLSSYKMSEPFHVLCYLWKHIRVKWNVDPEGLQNARVAELITEALKRTGFQTRILHVNTRGNAFKYVPRITTRTVMRHIS